MATDKVILSYADLGQTTVNDDVSIEFLNNSSHNNERFATNDSIIGMHDPNKCVRTSRTKFFIRLDKKSNHYLLLKTNPIYSKQTMPKKPT